MEVFNASQAVFVDQMEAGRRVSGPVRLALAVHDAEAVARAFEPIIAASKDFKRPVLICLLVRFL